MTPSIVTLSRGGKSKKKSTLDGSYQWTNFTSGEFPVYFQDSNKHVMFYDSSDRRWKVSITSKEIIRDLETGNQSVHAPGVIESIDFITWNKDYNLEATNQDEDVPRLVIEKIAKRESNIVKVRDPEPEEEPYKLGWGILILIIVVVAICVILYFVLNKKNGKKETLTVQEHSSRVNGNEVDDYGEDMRTIDRSPKRSSPIRTEGGGIYEISTGRTYYPTRIST